MLAAATCMTYDLKNKRKEKEKDKDTSINNQDEITNYGGTSVSGFVPKIYSTI